MFSTLSRFPTLSVTSPMTQNKHVGAAQWLLKHNRWGMDFMPLSPVDGQYGPHTASAAMRAKEFLGYPVKHINGSFGWHLYGYLVDKDMRGHLHLPEAYKTRKHRRAVRTFSFGERALKVAMTQIGTVENPPGSNIVKYSEWYGLIGPWCAMFVSWCFSHVGSSFHYSYVPTIYSDAQEGRNGLSLVREPKPGDLALYSFDATDPLGHVGFYKEPVAAGEFNDVSGNTGMTSAANGGEVLESLRFTNVVAAWVRVSR